MYGRSTIHFTLSVAQPTTMLKSAFLQRRSTPAQPHNGILMGSEQRCKLKIKLHRLDDFDWMSSKRFDWSNPLFASLSFLHVD